VVVLGAAAIGGLLQAAPAGAATKQYTFTHTSGQRVTCTWEHLAFASGDQGNGYAAFTRVVNTDPRCAAIVEVSIDYTDTYGNRQDVKASGDGEVFLEASRVREDVTSTHKVFFRQCVDNSRNVCSTGVSISAK
jgi:hypothetical protein